jgi:c(7)-type cytochrome triheme protein
MSTPKRTRIIVAGASLLSLLISAALLAEEPGKSFSHAFHLKQGADCDNCHLLKPGAPLPEIKKEGCNDCHDQGPPPWVLPAKAARLKARFDHGPHVKALKCLDCHAPIAKDKQEGGRPILDQAACSACHEKRSVKVGQSACARCHGVDARKSAPSDHRHAWLSKHGQEAEWRSKGEHGKDCGACHRNDGCKTCHLTQKPHNHTALWRMRTHGLEAEWSRESCKVCHETGTCIRCHRNTPPLNHQGAWSKTHGLTAAGAGNEHCAVCHNPSFCAHCHGP